MHEDVDASALQRAHGLLRERAKQGPHSEDPTRPDTVQAMQIALHLPKPDYPPRHAVLAAAARAVVAVCLDPRAGHDQEYRAALERWYGHLIRKVARRARGAGWENAQHITGVTVTHRTPEGDASARAFLPGAVHEVPHVLRKLQISGTDLPYEDAAVNPAAALVTREGLRIAPAEIYVDRGLGMTVGKAAAQVGHASMLLAAHRDIDVVRPWAEAGFPLEVYEVDTQTFRALGSGEAIVGVRDAGFTEVAPGALTAFARGLDVLAAT